MQSINDVINKINATSNKKLLINNIYIYGAGGYGRSLMKSLLELNVKFCGFIDQKRNEDVDGYSCIRLDDPVCNKYKNTDKVVILIGIHNRDTDPYKIKSELKMLGFCNVYTPVEYYNELPDGVSSPYWLAKYDFYKQNIDNIRFAYKKIENNEVFFDILLYRIGYTEALIYSKRYPQYRPNPILTNMAFSNFVDAGAYNGDTIKDFINEGIKITHYYAFEPDIKNYTELAKSMQEYKFNKYLFPAGLSDINEEVNFQSNGESGTCNELLIQGNCVTVPVVRLDDCIQGDMTIDFIKMDIEGLERSAILGSKAIIKAQKPVLAICVYHKPDDMWTILQLIENIVPDAYRYYLYQHELNTFEVVLYAIPR